MLDQILIQILSGLSRGMVLFVVASGLTLVFGTMRIANFAHGSFYMLAAFLTYSISTAVGHSTLGFLAALAIAPLAVAAVGAAIEALLLRRIAMRPHQYQLILTYAVTLVVADGIKALWGRSYHTVDRPSGLNGAVFIFDMPFPSYNFVLIISGLVIAVLLHLMLTRTRFGKTVRAAVLDGEMVGALGVNVQRLFTGVFALGAGLAGVGGVLAAPVGSVSLGLDTSIIIESFAVIIIGGVGSVPGALIGALLIGVLQAVGILFAPKMAIAFIFMAVCIVLVVRPQGLLGRAT